MDKAIRNIHWLFWGCIPFLLIYSFFTTNEIDINIHDIMFIIAAKHIAIFFSLTCFIIGLGYYLSYKSDKFKPVNALTLLHVVLTFTGLILSFSIPEYRIEIPIESLDNMTKHLDTYIFYNNLKLGGGLAVLVAQPIFLLNLTVSLFRK